MSAEITTQPTESELLYEYLSRQMREGGRDRSVRELLYSYVEYRKQLEDLRSKLREAEASSARGESADFDIEELIAEVTHELAAEGIT